ncbi:GTP 3',8-cyclase MoaA [Haloimpatiens sp. FM7330]|uniref:GTP 3',8-cyclase MoaA n=1 Tax=Haloimpatiens sp. FM7330 TaxID=3298610 RepID=UPI00363B7A8B
MKDLYGRNINYLRISVTDLCNLRCKYCTPRHGISKIKHDEILTFEEIEKITKIFVSLGVNKVRITGGEPLVRKGILSLIKKIGEIKEIKDFAITTNGILLKKYAKDLKQLGVNRVNVSLDTLDPKKYKEITRGGQIHKVFDGIEEARKVGLDPIKINTVLVGGFNDNEIENFVNLTLKDNLEIRFIELMPIGEAKEWDLDKFITNEVVLDKIKELKEIESQDICSPAKYYKLPHAKGKIGLISPITHKFCCNCNRVRLTADGKLKLCLHSNEEIDLKTLLRNGQDIEDIIIKSIQKKPKSHNLENGEYTKRNMMAIGG